MPQADNSFLFLICLVPWSVPFSTFPFPSKMFHQISPLIFVFVLLAIDDVQECDCGFLLEEGECMGLKHRDLYKRDIGELEPPHLTGHIFQESDQEV